MIFKNKTYRVTLSKKAIKFIEALAPNQKQEIDFLMLQLKRLGYELDYPHSKKLTGTKNKLYELRCSKYGNRMYYFFKGDDIYLIINGGNKTSQKKDILYADKYISNNK